MRKRRRAFLGQQSDFGWCHDDVGGETRMTHDQADKVVRLLYSCINNTKDAADYAYYRAEQNRTE
jgi:hypothetical protein